jgi:uncharacterized protein (DUF486 family)
VVRRYRPEERLAATKVTSTPYRLALVYVALAPIPLAFTNQPLLIIRTYTIVGSLFIPFLAATLLYLNNFRIPANGGVRRTVLLQTPSLSLPILFAPVGERPDCCPMNDRPADRLEYLHDIRPVRAPAFRESPLWIAIVVSWMIASRSTASRCRLTGCRINLRPRNKTIQEVITLIVLGFSVTYLRESSAEHVVAFALIVAAVFFMFMNSRELRRTWIRSWLRRRTADCARTVRMKTGTHPRFEMFVRISST